MATNGIGATVTAPIRIQSPVLNSTISSKLLRGSVAAVPASIESDLSNAFGRTSLFKAGM